MTRPRQQRCVLFQQPSLELSKQRSDPTGSPTHLDRLVFVATFHRL